MKRRGQTLVIFALTLLLLTLMVTMTLSIGMKAKEKMEMQTVADAAAYSGAVATARTFNSISIMNRALMGHMVAMTGVESLISWSSYYRGSIQGARNAYNIAMIPYVLLLPCCVPTSGCFDKCACAIKAIGDIQQTRSDLDDEDKKLDSDWKSLDQKAGLEARKLQIGTVSKEQKKIFGELKSNKLQQLADEIAKAASKGYQQEEELVANNAPKKVNDRELGGSCEGGNGVGASCENREADKKLHFVYAAMGSRGHKFLTGRDEAEPIKSKLKKLLPQKDTLDLLTNEGSGYFPKNSKTHSGSPIDATELWADDDGFLMLTFKRGQSPCPTSSPGFASPTAEVRSNHDGDGSDHHKWTNGQDDDAKHHTMGHCTNCPGMWPMHMDYNSALVSKADDNWGQPKLYSLILRDYSRRTGAKADPWNLAFRFRFTSSGEGSEFDNRGIKLVSTGEDISQATALSAGIAYYRRTGEAERWKEPPNFLNPFWRATLVSAQVDKQGEQDIGETLKPVAPFAAEVYEALKSKEYMAW